MIDYRKFRLRKLNDPEFSHLKLLLFWPVYGLVFLGLERFVSRDYYTVYCPLDSQIPFCEFFLLPYLFWFVFLVGMLLYLLLFDVPGFRKYMWFIILTYSATCLIYILWPTKQELRPDTFARDNVLTRFMAWFYTFDTNTNVCPSLHVIGSLAVAAAAWNTPRFAKPLWRAVFCLAALSICVSTVFLKQHSVLDIPPAVALCALAYWPVYRRKPRGS